MGPAFAKSFGIQTGDLVQIAITEKGVHPEPIKRELVIAALVSPGHADNSVTIPLGYSRRMPEFSALPYSGGALKEEPGIAEQSGVNASLMRTVGRPQCIAACERGMWG